MTTYCTADDLPERYRAQARAKLFGAPVTPNTPAPPRTPSKRSGKAEAPSIPQAWAEPGSLVNGRMNKTESAYAGVLDAEKGRGEILWWSFGAVALRIGEKCFYHPDFLVMLADGRLELRETKGFMRDDANVKLRAIREMYPFFGLVVVRKGKGGTWEYERR